MQTILKTTVAVLFALIIFQAPAGARNQGDLLGTDVYVRAPAWVYVYVVGAPRNVKRCVIDGTRARVESYEYDKTVSFCSLNKRHDYRRVAAKKRVKVTVVYTNGRVRSAFGKVTWDGSVNP